MPTGSSACIVVSVLNWKRNSAASVGTVIIGSTASSWTFTGAAQINWTGYSTNIYGSTVDVPACIDPEITQRAFLKDIIQRFNLVVLTNPDDDTNLIIEPYNDFIASGELKHWSDKVDLDKEVIIKDTTQLQKKIINLTDQEDSDLWNKAIKEKAPDQNVYGHLRIDNFNNNHATGELKNASIFSPYINDKIYQNANSQDETILPNFTVQYEFTYEESGNEVKNPIKKTKPKLFYYSGVVTTVKDVNGDTATYNLHSPNPTSESISTLTFTTYPVCSPFDITTTVAGIANLGPGNKSLYWNATVPAAPNLDVFNEDGLMGNWFNNTLYGLYWKPYLDNIYSTEARIMECYLNLDEVDIFNFSFADEIFIKDSYWRILNIHNYQVGAKASTKVTLIKSLDIRENCNGCDYVLGATASGNNMLSTGGGMNAGFLLWCPDDDPSCSPDVTSPDYLGTYTSPECCVCNGGWVQWNATAQASNNLYPCWAIAGSIPHILSNKDGVRNFFSNTQAKTIIHNLMGPQNRPFVIGSDNNKYSTPIFPLYSDDSVIKYKNKLKTIPSIQGESHRMVLIGYTIANTRAYAYQGGDQFGKDFIVPPNTNVVLKVKGVSTVIGGSSSTYPLGSTEAFAYHTAFKTINDTSTQIGTAGGVQDWSIKEVSTTCTLYIDISGGVLRFGLDDSQTDTKRIWTLTADIDVNIIDNMLLEYGGNWALFQNGRRIQLQNGDFLLWN